MPEPWTAYEKRILRMIRGDKPPYYHDVSALLLKRRQFVRRFRPYVLRCLQQAREIRRLKAELEKLRGSAR